MALHKDYSHFKIIYWYLAEKRIKTNYSNAISLEGVAMCIMLRYRNLALLAQPVSISGK